MRDICCVYYLNFKKYITHIQVCFETSKQVQGVHTFQMSIYVGLRPQKVGVKYIADFLVILNMLHFSIGENL